MKCPDLENYLMDYLEGDLPLDKTDELLAHVEECDYCRGEFRAYQQQEERLSRFFKAQVDAAAAPRNPVAGLTRAGAEAEPVRSPRRRWWWPTGGWAAAAALLLCLSYGAWEVNRRNVARGDAQLATVRVLEGKARTLAFSGAEFLRGGGAIRQAQKIKVPVGGYLSLALMDGNIVEVRGGTQLALRDFPDRLEVALDRGSVWLHLNNRKPAKPHLVTTAHLRATATGTVFGVEEGLGHSVVAVGEGTVLVESGGTQTNLAAGQSYSSRRGATVGGAGELAHWSRYPQNVAALLPATPAAPERSALDVEMAAAPTSGALAGSKLPLADLLPKDTLFYIEVGDLAGLLREFKVSDYAGLFDRPEIADWWKSVHGNDIMDEDAAKVLSDLVRVVQLVDGGVALGVGPSGHFLAVADCGATEQELWRALDEIFTRAQPRRQVTADEWSRLRQYIRIGGGRVMLSSDAALARTARKRLETGEASGFRESAFRRKLMKDIEQPRFIAAVNLAALVTRGTQGVKQNSAEEALLNLYGVYQLDYLLLSPSFKGRGMRQAARLAFDGERYGLMSWLAAPGPMRSMDFFSPNVHFFAAGVTRDPRLMFLDLMDIAGAAGEQRGRGEMAAFLERHDALLEAFGNEIAIGLESPMLPIPNVKIAIELDDQATVEAGLDALIEDYLRELGHLRALVTRLETKHGAFTIHSLNVAGLPVDPSYAFVNGFLIAGPGPAFVRDSIQVFESGNAITHNARLARLLPQRGAANYSLLVYQNLAKMVPDLLKTGLAPKLKPDERALIPDLEFLGRYETASIAYAYARPSYIDFYFTAPDGLDLNVGLTAPLVAKWLTPRDNVAELLSKYDRVRADLETMRAAARAFQQANGRLPRTLFELGSQVGRVPLDPFAPVGGRSLLLIPGAQEGEIVIYSVGPDGVDDRGVRNYDPEKDVDGTGDILIRLTSDE